MVVINVCIGSACHLKGAYNVLERLQQLIKDRDLEDQVTLKAAFCLGQCTQAVSVRINDDGVVAVSDKDVDEFFEESIIGRLSN
ncbi:Thioredoxin-like [2Fe-2S] ferredoxin [Natronincola peptidivorans]|uniref:Thioredoxin-like [2Fe-2S] ferredoxin n=1 Tax=Natronincola peptidivorans TaxID=426128 RepID=A0A1I0C7I9_9FIRM|nr:(2Fe-2S) ferredoxin domain-containing protein [Natronincola peptidivorans]SET15425.1 Thioredoxin-like [2Fe-2S] ferredoxin [Natronincola peptidivorans]